MSCQGGKSLVESNLTIIVIFVLYLVMMLAIGLMAYKKTSNTEDYFLGGRKLGSWVVSLSAQASDMSGWMLIETIKIYLE